MRRYINPPTPTPPNGRTRGVMLPLTGRVSTRLTGWIGAFSAENCSILRRCHEVGLWRWMNAHRKKKDPRKRTILIQWCSFYMNNYTKGGAQCEDWRSEPPVSLRLSAQLSSQTGPLSEEDKRMFLSPRGGSACPSLLHKKCPLEPVYS